MAHKAPISTSPDSTAIGQMADMLDEGLLLTNSDGVVLSANRAAVRLFDGNIISASIFDVIDDQAFGQAFHQTALKRVELEIPYRPKDETIHREFILRLKRLGDGPVALLFLDVTRQKNLENVRRDFVANVSHELRSPLTSLAGFIETMLDGEVPDEAMRTRFLRIMDEEAKRMSRLIDDLLSLSRVEVDEHIVPDNQVKLIDVIVTVRDSLIGRASQRGMTITFSDQRTDQTRIPVMLGSFDEMTEVFVNIVENAIKYGYENTQIEISIVEVSSNRLQIDVTNHGEGIEQRHLPRLTERFYRVDKARSRQIGGTGLGLAIVKHIVNRHRGTLTVTSKLNDTTKFSVSVPLIHS
ncbi:MAG: ATP-binding protein [Candidatus Puniceispirillaceae bacterium]|jgi:two-component system phosphate regulon sensor histidine kinase PhoR